MDISIYLVTPAMQRQRGADAFDRGHGINDHHMNPGRPAIADWQAGWRQQQVRSLCGTGSHTLCHQVEVSPP